MENKHNSLDNKKNSSYRKIRFLQKNSVLLLVLIFISLSSLVITITEGQDKNKRIQEIQQEMLALIQKAQACYGDPDCLTPIQKQLEALTKEYSEMTSIVGGTSEPCTSSPDPCCSVERFKQYIRDTYSVEPTWIQCMPVNIELVWDIYEETHTSMIKYVLKQEYSGYLSLAYDQQDKTRLKDFHIAGPMPQDQVRNVIMSIQGAFTPNYAKSVKIRTSNSPNDYAVGTRQGLNFDWSSDYGSNVFICVTGPWPREGFCAQGCLEYACAFGEIRFNGKGAEAISWDELKQGFKSGRCMKEYRIEWLPEAVPDWVRKGKVTVTVNLKPTGGLKVTPGDGFMSLGPDMNNTFDPPSKVYNLKNTSKSPINYRVGKTADWLNVSPTSGVITSDGIITVKVLVNEEKTKKLKSGTYEDTLAFTNTTNGEGNVIRHVQLTVNEEQKWRILLSGQETDDIGGKLMYMKVQDKWKNQVVKYGVRFQYKVIAEFTIKKKEGKWIYKNGKITSASVMTTHVFDPTLFIVKDEKAVCKNCQEVSKMAGKNLPGELSGNTVRLIWPNVIARAIVYSKYNKNNVESVYSDESRGETLKGYSVNEFESECFFLYASEHNLPLRDGELPPFARHRKSYADKFRQGSEVPIHVYHHYVMKRIK